jgi:hypothetical protein
MGDIAALLERVTAATGSNRELDGDIALAFGLPPSHLTRREDGWLWYQFIEPDDWDTWEAPTYTASVDAALALVERCGFPLGEGKWNYTMAAAYGSFSIMPNDPQSTGIHDKRGGHARGAPTIPLSIIVALLSAIIARQALKDSSHE